MNSNKFLCRCQLSQMGLKRKMSLVLFSPKRSKFTRFTKIMWFIILTTRYVSNPKAIVWNGSEKFMSVKQHLLPNSLNTLKIKINQTEVILQHWKTVLCLTYLQQKLNKTTTELYHLILKIMPKLKKCVKAFLKYDVSPSFKISSGC